MSVDLAEYEAATEQAAATQRLEDEVLCAILSWPVKVLALLDAAGEPCPFFDLGPGRAIVETASAWLELLPEINAEAARFGHTGDGLTYFREKALILYVLDRVRADGFGGSWTEAKVTAAVCRHRCRHMYHAVRLRRLIVALGRAKREGQQNG